MNSSHRFLLGVFAPLCLVTSSASAQIWSYATGQSAPSVGQLNPGVTGEYRYDWANQWGGFGTSEIYTIAPNYVGDWEGSAQYNYTTPPGGASWTSMAPDGRVPNLGTYTFIYQFNNLAEETSGYFDMSFVVDDKVTDVLLNGTSIYGNNGPLGSWLEVTTLESIPVTVLSGTNTLSVVVSNTTWNQGGQIANLALGATYQITTLTSIPEPNAILLASLGIVAFLWRKRRHAPR